MSLEHASDHEPESVRFLVWPYFALVMIHLASNIGMQQPFVLADELGYLGNARYLSGAAHLPNMLGTQFYHFGYSLFLIPAFWLFSNPVWIYKTVLIINALLASSLIVPLFYILTRLLRVPGRSARWIAFACCVYPSLILYSTFAWSESAYVPLYATAIALFGRLLSERSTTAALLFGGATGFLYTVHPRGLPVVAAAAGSLLLLGLLRSLAVRQLMSALSAMAGVVAITRIVNGHLEALGWAGQGHELVHKLAGRVVSDGDFWTLLERAAGQLLYMGQASFGLAILGLLGSAGLIAVAVRSRSFRAALTDPLVGTLGLTILSSGAILLASAASKVYGAHGPQGVEGSALIYGRYNEALAVMLIAFALALLWHRHDNGSKRVLWSAAVVVAIMLCLTWVVMAEINDALVRHVADTPAVAPLERIPPSGVRANSAPGIYPLVVLFDGLEIGAVSLVSMFGFAVITGAMCFSRRLGITILVASFGCVAVANYRLFVVPAMEGVKPRLLFVERVSRLGFIDGISYDKAYFDRSLVRGIQYLMQDTVFVRFNSRRGDEPQTEAVISARNWRQAPAFGAKFFVLAPRGNNALWLMPGELQSKTSFATPHGELLGPQPPIGVRFRGFGRRTLEAGTPGRWTQGSAEIRLNVDPRNVPRMLGLEIGPTRRDGIRFELRVNGVTLWDGPVPRRGAFETFDLGHVPIRAEYTIAFIPHPAVGAEKTGDSAGRPELGLFFRQVRLEGCVSLGSAVVGGLTLGTDQVLGVPESGFHRPESFGSMPARWTDGAARLRILIDPRHPPTRLEVATAAPGRHGALLRVTANNVDLWSGPIPSEAWSRSFDLADVTIRDALNLELVSDTFRPAETVEGSKDHRTLGVMVRSIRLLTEGDSDDR